MLRADQKSGLVTRGIAEARSRVSNEGKTGGWARGDYGSVINASIDAVSGDVVMSDSDRQAIFGQVFDAVVPNRLGPIEALLADPGVTEIMVNGPDDVFFEYKGVIRRANVRFDDGDAGIMAVINRIVIADGRLCDEAHPLCDCSLHRPGEDCDGSRVNVVIPPIAVDHPMIDIRKFRHDIRGVNDLIDLGEMDIALAHLLRDLVVSRMNVVIVGGTGSGKTTLLNVVAQFIPASERVITIEDTPELSIDRSDLVRFGSRDPNIEGKGEVTIRRLVKNALRDRPDRIIIGECREAETLDMLQAMSTGHDGSLTTVHANSNKDAIDRMNVMVHYGNSSLPENIVRRIIASAVNFFVNVERFNDGKRRVVEVREVQGFAGDVVTTEPIWEFEHTGLDKAGHVVGRFVPTGRIPTQASLDKLADHGCDADPSRFRKRA